MAILLAAAIENYYRCLQADDRHLEIARAQTTDTARYTCIASNKAGELQRNFEVEVLGKYNLPSQILQQSMQTSIYCEITTKENYGRI